MTSTKVWLLFWFLLCVIFAIAGSLPGLIFSGFVFIATKLNEIQEILIFMYRNKRD